MISLRQEKLIHVLASPTEGLSPLVVTPVNRECFCGYKDKVVTHCTYRFHRRPAHRQTAPSCMFYWHTGRHNVPIQVHRSRFSVAHFCESFCWRQRIGWNVSAQNRQRQNYRWFQWWIVRALFLEERDVSFNQGHLNEISSSWNVRGTGRVHRKGPFTLDGSEWCFADI